MVQERVRDEYELNEQIKSSDVNAVNKLEVTDEKRANKILAEKFRGGHDGINIETSDDYEFAMELQQQFKSLLE